MMLAANDTIGSEKWRDLLRSRCVELPTRRILVASMMGSKQSDDLSAPPNCEGLGRIRHFHLKTKSGWPSNFLPSLPASKWLDRTVEEATRAQVFQIAGCTLRCWYCYVPYQLLSGNSRHAEWKTADQLIDLFSAEENRTDILDLSGGAPELAPEWIAWTIEALQRVGLDRDVYLWSDDSLTTDLLMTPSMRPILRAIESHRGYGRVCCIKGFNAQSYEFATRGSGEGFDRQLDVLEQYLASDMDIYGYVTFASLSSGDEMDSINRLLDRLQRMKPDFPERVVPLRIERYSTMTGRMSGTQELSLSNQDRVVELWMNALKQRGLSLPEQSWDNNDQ